MQPEGEVIVLSSYCTSSSHSREDYLPLHLEKRSVLMMSQERHPLRLL